VENSNPQHVRMWYEGHLLQDHVPHPTAGAATLVITRQSLRQTLRCDTVPPTFGIQLPLPLDCEPTHGDIADPLGGEVSTCRGGEGRRNEQSNCVESFVLLSLWFPAHLADACGPRPGHLRSRPSLSQVGAACDVMGSHQCSRATLHAWCRCLNTHTAWTGTHAGRLCSGRQAGGTRWHGCASLRDQGTMCCCCSNSCITHFCGVPSVTSARTAGLGRGLPTTTPRDAASAASSFSICFCICLCVPLKVPCVLLEVPFAPLAAARSSASEDESGDEKGQPGR
jgi:hypothetical protein